MEGIFIPMEFYKNTELKGLERDVLALYKYYTENGNNKCCSLNSVQIAEMFNVSSRYIKSVRQHLKELGYIKTDGGIKVIYVGIKGEPQLVLKKDYRLEDYKRFDERPDIINIDRISDIPSDYYDVMGVPVTFIEKWNPGQFDIVGMVYWHMILDEKGHKIKKMRLLIKRK